MEAEWGNIINIPKFHNLVLEVGCVPVELLEDKIDNGYLIKNNNKNFECVKNDPSKRSY